MVLGVLAAATLRPAAAADARDALEELLSAYHSLGLFNGTVLVADGGEVVFAKGYGLANMEWSIPNTPDTKFRLGSITKQFTATLVLQLVEQGQLALDAPIRRYLPEYPAPAGETVTIHHLLNHTSGIVGYTETPGFGATARNRYAPTAFADEKFARLDLLFEPGTKFSYSNSGYFLLGVILEKVTGQPYEALLRERIFAPLGMKDSGYDSTQPLLPRRAAGYARQFDGTFVNAEFIDMTQPYSAGALYSTVEDLYRWDQALYSDKVLTPASRERMFTPGLSDYGYGWVIRRADGVTTIEHGGGIPGFATLISRNPESKRLVVLLSNTADDSLDSIARGVRAILDGKPPGKPKRPAAKALFETYQASGLAAALARAREMQAGTDFDASNGQLARLAGQLLASGRNVDALELAEKLAKDSPRSASAAAFLARAHRANGHRIEAIQNLSRAIELSDTPRALLMYTQEIQELSRLEPGKDR